ncbi:MAG: hypothetical protein ABIG32_03075, partial [Candidatus Uhrbacteria bacterium]
RIFISPDETANFYFATEFVENSKLYVFEPLNQILGDVIHPRSVFSVDGRLLPVSFVGLPVLYGLVGKIGGVGIMVFITPFVAALALFAWRGTVERIFNRKIAFVSTVLLAFHPAWWYYTARGMMHNALFMSLVVFAAWFLVARPFRSRWADLDLVLSGLLLGLGLFVRTAEVFWLLPVAILILIMLGKRIHWRGALLFGLSVLIALTPMFFLNRSMYGGPLEFGYMAQNTTGVTSVSLSEQDVLTDITPNEETSVLPFDFNLRSILRHTLHYGMELFWWFTILVLIGIPLAIRGLNGKRKPSEESKKYLQWTYHGVFFVAGALLAGLYGSWTFTDNPDPNTITIANSYVRYWLPVFLLTTVYAATVLVWLKDRMRTKLSGTLIVAAALILFAGLGIRGTFLAAEDGLVEVRSTLIRSHEIKTSVLNLTEPDAVIVVDRADKIFFPERKVMYPLRSDKTYELMPRIVLRNPLYYYGVTFPETDVEYLNTKKLAELGLQIELIETYDEESLYRITQAL